MFHGVNRLLDMNPFEIPQETPPTPEQLEKPELHTEEGVETLIPDDFRDDPMGYFEQQGVNIKPGEAKYDEGGQLREDPTAVKELPEWEGEEGDRVRPIGKRVNVAKGEVGTSGDPFYEYRIIREVRRRGLPAPRPLAAAKQGDNHLIVMERVPGVTWYDKSQLALKEQGWSDEDIQHLLEEAEIKMSELAQQFGNAGIHRKWKLKDMIFDINFDEKHIRSITPVDWERTIIDEQ